MYGVRHDPQVLQDTYPGSGQKDGTVGPTRTATSPVQGFEICGLVSLQTTLCSWLLDMHADKPLKLSSLGQIE